jgi:hypothetical protein
MGITADRNNITLEGRVIFSNQQSLGCPTSVLRPLRGLMSPIEFWWNSFKPATAVLLPCTPRPLKEIQGRMVPQAGTHSS